MLLRVPDYYDRFECLAGGCPHSCCEKWEVVIDEDHAALYAGVPGPLGDQLRSSLQRDADGDLCFSLNGGRCPFLRDDNLCEIHRQLGEDATSITCQEHPRFTEDYGPFREVTLSASCPAAGALLLGSEEALRFTERITDAPEEAGDEWLPYLLPLRARLMNELQNRTLPLSLRLRRFLLLAEEAQTLLDEGSEDELPALAAKWQADATASPVAAELPAAFDALQLLPSLETLDADWHELLRQAANAAPVAVSEKLLDRIAVYFAFRWLLKCVNDGDLLSRAKLCVLAVSVIRTLAAVCGLSEALRRFSCEVEHSDENVDALLGILFALPAEALLPRG